MYLDMAFAVILAGPRGVLGVLSEASMPLVNELMEIHQAERVKVNSISSALTAETGSGLSSRAAVCPVGCEC